MSSFRRKSAATAEPGVAETATADTGAATESAEEKTAPARPRRYTVSKRELGKITPKRRQGGRRAEPPPANRREALKRLREKQRQAREEARAGMLAGKEEYLPPRDKGPERRLVRDIVDARRNLASWFLPGALVVILGSSPTMPAAIQIGANVFWIMLAAAVIVDSFLLTRRVKKIMLRRFPKAAKPPRAHYFYAIMRSFQFRRLRIPAPQVKPGERIA
ncbi:MAG: DUF3043 domain-containing protein [Micromonosporaceae bacterium]|nr:DUF3043 domain-containing protein [Micromonosporaceae bacterium]